MAAAIILRRASSSERHRAAEMVWTWKQGWSSASSVVSRATRGSDERDLGRGSGGGSDTLDHKEVGVDYARERGVDNAVSVGPKERRDCARGTPAPPDVGKEEERRGVASSDER